MGRLAQTLGVMKPPLFALSAASKTDLFAQLRRVDITVPLITEGRTKEHRERYLMARILATLASADLLAFPIKVFHSEKPDFLLSFDGSEIGAECVEVVPQELYEIEVLREKLYPHEMNFGQIFKPGQQKFTLEEKHGIARGEVLGPPWMPDMAKRNWIAAIMHFIAGKTKKLRNGNYSSTATNWLLLQDEWPTSLRFYPEQVREAAVECSKQVDSMLEPPSFQAIYVASGEQLLMFKRGSVRVEPIFNLWT